jgi:hypothetical protein
LIRLGKQSILYNQRNFTFGLSKTFKKTKEIISVYETIGSFVIKILFKALVNRLLPRGRRLP